MLLSTVDLPIERSCIPAAKTTRTKHMFSDTYKLVSAVLWRRRYDLATKKVKQSFCSRSLSMLMIYAAQVPRHLRLQLRLRFRDLVSNWEEESSPSLGWTLCVSFESSLSATTCVWHARLCALQRLPSTGAAVGPEHGEQFVSQRNRYSSMRPITLPCCVPTTCLPFPFAFGVCCCPSSATCLSFALVSLELDFEEGMVRVNTCHQGLNAMVEIGSCVGAVQDVWIATGPDCTLEHLMKLAHWLDGLQRQATVHRPPGRSQRAVQDLAEIFCDILAKLFYWLVCC